MESISRQESPEFTALELREALTHLGEITGAVDTEDVLGAIFSSFVLREIKQKRMLFLL